MKSAVLLLCLPFLGACASFSQAYSAAGQSALVDARAASDNALKTAVTGVCFTPYDTIVRNPDVVSGIMALCLPGGNLANPAAPLDVLTNKVNTTAGSTPTSTLSVKP